MGTGISALLRIGERTMINDSQAIRIVGANIANVNSPGYSRRRPEITFETSQNTGGDANFGLGSVIEKVVRMTDQFLNRELNYRIADRAQSEARNNQWTKVEEFFPLDNRGGIISTELTNFFASLQDLEESPSDAALRQRVIFTGNALTDSINRTFEGIASVQRDADTQIGFLVDDVNRLAGEVADLNSRIAASEAGGQNTLALRDSRDRTLRDLSQFIEFDIIEQSDSTVTVALSNGFALVNSATHRPIEFVDSPSYEPVGGFPPGLDGNPIRHLVFNFGDTLTRSDFNLTGVIASGTGEIGGLMTLRGVQGLADTSTFETQGPLVDIAVRIEAMTRQLMTRFNETYMGQLGNPAAPAVDLTGANPGPYSLFGGAIDSNANNLPDDLVGNVAYSSMINFGVTTPEELAAGWDLDAGAGVATAPGDSSNIKQLTGLKDEAYNYNLGTFTATMRINELITETTSSVGSNRARAKADFEFDTDREKVVTELQSSVSGVSLDEEFAELVNLQRLFQGAAKMIQTGDELLQIVVNLVR